MWRRTVASPVVDEPTHFDEGDARLSSPSRRPARGRAVAFALVGAALLASGLFVVHTAARRASKATPGPAGAAPRDAAAALKDLRRRVRRLYGKNASVPLPEKKPRWAKTCDAECRLQTCSRPFARLTPGERLRSAERRKYLEPQNATTGPADRPVRGDGRAPMRVERRFWRSRVDAAGVLAFQRRIAANAARSPRVPCVAQNYPDELVGLREHVPPRDAPRPPPDADAEKLRERLHELQDDVSKCADARAETGIGRVGLGGVLKILTLGFTWAFDQGKTYHVQDHQLTPSSRSLWELLEPPSKCDRVPDENEWDEHATTFRRGKYAPPDYAHRGHFWWVAQLIGWLFRPKPDILKAVDEAMAVLPKGEPFVGLHVRHGDKCRGERPDGPSVGDPSSFLNLDDTGRPEDHRIECGSFTEYMIHVQRLHDLYGVKNVWLATDDADVVDRATRDPCYAHFDFYFLKYDRLTPDQYAYVDKKTGEEGYSLEECQNAGSKKSRLKCPLERDRFDETRTMVVDLAILARADALVVSLWSNIGRLALEVSVAEKGCVPPVISRDVGWCSTDGQIHDGTIYGHLNC